MKLGYYLVLLFLLADSTIAPPPKTSGFLYRTFHGCSTQGRLLLRKKYPCILVCKGQSIDHVAGCRGAPYLGKYGRELVLKPAILFKKIWEGASAERLLLFIYIFSIIFSRVDGPLRQVSSITQVRFLAYVINARVVHCDKIRSASTTLMAKLFNEAKFATLPSRYLSLTLSKLQNCKLILTFLKSTRRSHLNQTF